MTTYTAHEILGGRDWVDDAAGKVVYAGGAAV